MPVLVAVACVGLVTTGCSSGPDIDGATPTTSEARGPAAPSNADISALTAKVSGGGASFPDAFYQAVATDFNAIAGHELVTYAKSGSSDGRQQLAAGTLDLGGSDSLPKPTETWPSQLLLFPTVAAPITVSYNIDGVEDLRLSQDTLAGIFQTKITRWDDPEIRSDNPDADLPDERITVVHRSDGSGTTNNFTSYLTEAAPEVWTLGAGDTVNWSMTTQGAEKNSGVASVIGQTEGAIGYVDLADAVKADLDLASIRNRDGRFVGPTADGTASAVAHAEIADDLSYDPLDAPGAGTYPITAPTYLMVLEDQPGPDTADTVRTYLRYVLTTGQDEALPLGYVPLSDELRRRAYDQVDQIDD